MKIYPTVNDVIDDLEQLNWSGEFFVNSELWDSSPHEARFIYLDGDDEMDDIVDDETMLPRLTQENDVERLLGMQAFNDVVINRES